MTSEREKGGRQGKTRDGRGMTGRREHEAGAKDRKKSGGEDGGI